MSTTAEQVSAGERIVLSCVPPSTRGAFRNVQDVIRFLQANYGLQSRTIYTRLQRLEELGLIDRQTGYCRRTVDGDAVLGAQGVG